MYVRSSYNFYAVPPKATKFDEVTQNNRPYAVQGDAFDTNRKLMRLPSSD